MVEPYHINIKLILYVTIAYGVDRILSKTNNYKIYKKILIVLALIAFVLSAKYSDNTINNTMSVILIGYIFDYYKNYKKSTK